MQYKKNTISKRFKTELIRNGFKKHPFEVMAHDEREAFNLLQKDNDLNLESLREFSFSVFFISCVCVFVVIASFVRFV